MVYILSDGDRTKVTDKPWRKCPEWNDKVCIILVHISSWHSEVVTHFSSISTNRNTF